MGSQLPPQPRTRLQLAGGDSVSACGVKPPSSWEQAGTSTAPLGVAQRGWERGLRIPKVWRAGAGVPGEVSPEALLGV